MRHTFFTFLLLLLIGNPLFAAETDNLSSRIDSIFAVFNSADVPGCAVGVIHNGEYVINKGYGSANLEQGIPISADSVFRIGSVSKQFTALAIAILAERGELDLQADIHDYLPELRDYGVKVTIDQMVHHLSGMGDYDGFFVAEGKPFRFGNEDYWTIEEFYQQVAQQPLLLPPGERFEYSNIAYFLLSQVVERISGKTLRQFAKQEIFTPLEMNATFFNDNVDGIVPNRADGYQPLETGGFEILMTNLDWVGDGGVYTSLNDFIKWDQAFMTGNVPGGAKIQELMVTPDPLTLKTLGDENSFAYENGYGFGLTIGKFKDHVVQYHTGSWVGFRASYTRFPDDNFSIVTLCNRSDAGKGGKIDTLTETVFAEFAK
jgi:CubicO group peptidase (beta-lactamase class C family)